MRLSRIVYGITKLTSKGQLRLQGDSKRIGQGSNLALANLLNASSFLQMQVEIAITFIFSMWKQVALISTKLCNTAEVVWQTV